MDGEVPGGLVVMILCLRCHGLGSIPGWGTESLQPTWHSLNKQMYKVLKGKGRSGPASLFTSPCEALSALHWSREQAPVSCRWICPVPSLISSPVSSSAQAGLSAPRTHGSQSHLIICKGLGDLHHLLARRPVNILRPFLQKTYFSLKVIGQEPPSKSIR